MKEETRNKISNGLSNLKWVLFLSCLVFIKIFMDSAQNQVDNENKIIINVMMSDSLGSKVIAVKKVK